MHPITRVALAAAWLAWAYPFIFRAPHSQKRESVTVATPTRIGIVLQIVGIGTAFIHRSPPRVNSTVLIAMLFFAALGIVLSWTAVRHLGKQFRVQAGLYVDHELVRTGPYAIVRHPIYASLLSMLLATIALLTPWPRAIISLVFFVIGTEIRVRTEDRLLASRFGEEFEKYRKSVPAYVPLVR